MIGFFIPIAEALIVGYVIAIAVYMFLLLGITRLGRSVLLKDNGASSIYTMLHTGAWTVAALAGAYFCCGMSPLGPYGLVGFPSVLAITMGLLAFRNFRQLPGQMSVFALLMILIGIITGTAGALYLRHAFTALKNA